MWLVPEGETIREISEGQSMHSLLSRGNGLAFIFSVMTKCWRLLIWKKTWCDFEFWKNHFSYCARIYWRGSLVEKRRGYHSVPGKENGACGGTTTAKIWVGLWIYFVLVTTWLLLLSRVSHKRGKDIQRFLVWEGLFGSFPPNLFCLVYHGQKES